MSRPPLPPASPRASRGADPQRLDVAAFAKAKAHLDGATPLAQMPRLADSVVAPSPDVQWHLDGLWKEATARPAEIRLRLQAQAQLSLVCQRCLQPSLHAVKLDQRFRFVETEDEAARLDEEAGDDEDVLVLPRSLKVADLIEDELLLALPIVPMHEVCPEPLPYASSSEAEVSANIKSTSVDDQPHPFAALAQLKTQLKKKS